MKKILLINSQLASKFLLLCGMILASIYLLWWFLPGHVGNPWLYSLLVIGEIYHVTLAILFYFTLWPGQKKVQMISNIGFQKKYAPSVDIFITVAGEPVEVVAETIEAAKNIDYSNFKIYLLNDGFVAKKDNWQNMEYLAKQHGIKCITRKIPGGAKAGNINNALQQTKGKLVAILDADMVPHPNFLARIVPFFSDAKIGFIQTPQYYKNNDLNQVTAGAWEQQELFFGPIMSGKNKSNASFICGTNVLIRRKALEEVGGMNEKNIAEDFLTSLEIHKNGWKSHYLGEILVEGLAPEDLLSYYKQQLRWARGSIEILFGYNPLFNSRLSWAQRFEYLSSGLYYLNGLVVLIDCIMPLIFLYFGIQPVSASTTNFALFFLPAISLNLYCLSRISLSRLTFRAMSFSHSSWILQLQALLSYLTNQKMAFSVTPKKAQEGNFLSLAFPHLIYTFLLIGGAIFAIGKTGFSPSVATNIAWGVFNISFFIPFILASYSWQKIIAGTPKVSTTQNRE